MDELGEHVLPYFGRLGSEPPWSALPQGVYSLSRGSSQACRAVRFGDMPGRGALPETS
jgi:hypothetical protein